MDWLHEFKDDLIALEKIEIDRFGLDWKRLDETFAELEAEFDEILEPLQDGTIDPGDLQTITDKYWDRYGSREIEAAKKSVELHRRLTKLYERLAGANQEEWSEYAKTRVNVRFEAGSPIWQALAESLKD
jgi:hypothetical protein